MLSLASTAAYADETTTSSVSKSHSFKDITKNYSVRLGIESAGPIRFNDSPDQRLEKTSVFQYGGRLAFLLGNESKDAHRLGLGVGYSFVAKSESRKLNFTDIYAMYETGYPLILQLHSGYSIAGGNGNLSTDRSGIYNAAALRYSLDRPGTSSKVRVSPGLVAKSYLNINDAQDSSFFLGAQIEFTYNSNK